MTCIVGLISESGKVYIGGESAATADTARSIIRTPKTFVLSQEFDEKTVDIAFGYAGSIRMGQLLQYDLEIPDPEDLPPHKYIVTRLVANILEAVHTTASNGEEGLQLQTGSMVMVGYAGHLFSIWWDLNVEERAEGFSSIGSGSPYAIGFLYGLWDCKTIRQKSPRAIVKAALQCACNLDAACAPPFNIVSV